MFHKKKIFAVSYAENGANPPYSEPESKIDKYYQTNRFQYKIKECQEKNNI
jgi:hypothetical protein